MLATISNRLGQLALVIVGVSVIVFLLMHVLPGDVAQMLLGDHATPESLARLRAQLGIDRPIWVQYARFASKAVHGDFGVSLQTNHPAFEDVWSAFPVTLQLSLASLTIATLAGVPFGAFAALRPNSWLDNTVLYASLLGVSMPIFWLGLMLLLLFGGILGWLPIGGLFPPELSPPRVTGMSVIDALVSLQPDMITASLQHLVLPAFTLATIPLALIIRITRSEMLAVLTQDHVRAAWAKGLPRRRIIIRHVLRNALIPVVTVIGLQLGLLLSGAVLTETIFSLPGLGRLMVDSILSRDYPVVQAGALFIAVVFVLVNLIVDLSYTFLDPRIRRA
jgi:peptide/nickel transport system permease protein